MNSVSVRQLMAPSSDFNYLGILFFLETCDELAKNEIASV